MNERSSGPRDALTVCGFLTYSNKQQQGAAQVCTSRPEEEASEPPQSTAEVPLGKVLNRLR